MKIFAFLAEPASYTVDRNISVYDPMRVEYCYIAGDSEAKNTRNEETKSVLNKLPKNLQFKYIRHVLQEYDTIIYNGYTGRLFILLFLMNLLYRKPIGIDSDTQYREPSSLIKRWLKRIYLNIVFRNKNIYGLAGGNFTHKDLFRKFGMKEERILLMPMMVDNSRFDYAEYEQRQTDVMRFVYVGRLIECKNIETLIRAYINYHTIHANSELHIVGKGVLEEVLKDKYSSFESVFFDGPKYGEELMEVYQENNVLVLPSTYEPWGLVVNEAMSAGMPVLVSNEVGAHYDLVDGKNTGFVFDAKDEQSLLTAMERISDIETYRKYAKNAYNYLHNYWNYSLYRKCMENFIKATVR